MRSIGNDETRMTNDELNFDIRISKYGFPLLRSGYGVPIEE